MGNGKKILKKTSYEGVSYVCPSWEEMGEYTFDLARQIIESGRKFDRVVALAKGGWTWSRTMVDLLKIDKLSSTRLKSYETINESGRVKVLQPLSDPIDGERILIFDEVVDSGETIIKAKEYVEIMGGKEVTVAALCYKPRSEIVPEYYAFCTDAWVVFPHERREFIDIVSKKWLENDIPMEMIKSRLVTIGLPKNQVEYFSKREL
jgi:hypoxanthine phosphoribosyltransferase